MSYIVIHVYSIECDADGCRELAPDVVSPANCVRRLDDARRTVAVSDGWTTRDGKDYCPDHSEVV